MVEIFKIFEALEFRIQNQSNHSQAGQALQDVLLQLAGASLAGLELLLVSSDTLRLTTEGRAEVERSRGSHLGELLHPEVSN